MQYSERFLKSKEKHRDLQQLPQVCRVLKLKTTKNFLTDL